MRTKILGAVVFAAALALAGCSGGGDDTSSSSGGSTTGTNSNSGNNGSGSTGANTSSGSNGANNNGSSSSGGTNGQTTSANNSGSTGGGTNGQTTSANNSGSTGGGTNGANTSGSTGTNGSGTTDADCGASHAVCPGNGNTCRDWFNAAGGIPHVYGCGCDLLDLADGGSQDTCADNTDGNIVCDFGGTFTCRPPRDYEPAGVAGPNQYICDTNYIPVGFNDGHGGTEVLCINECSSTSDCLANFTYCETGAFSNDDDGGVIGGCFENDCGPDLTDARRYEDGGYVLTVYDDGGSDIFTFPDGGYDEVSTPAGAYYAACDTAGATNDPAVAYDDGGSSFNGTCQPLPTSSGHIGVCFRDGDKGIYETCSGQFSTFDGACQAGYMCVFYYGIPTGLPVGSGTSQASVCLATCNAGSGAPQQDCPTIQGEHGTCRAGYEIDQNDALAVGFCSF